MFKRDEFMEKIFTKENVLPCVLFGACLCFCIVKIVSKSQELSFICFVIATFSLALSFIEVIVEFLEKVNEHYTNRLYSYEKNECIKRNIVRLRADDEQYKLFYDNVEIIDRDLISKYRIIYKDRKKVRKSRRAFLYVKYASVMCVLIVLLLHYELYTIMPRNLISSDNSNIITLVTLMVLLFNLTLRGFVKKIVVFCIERKEGIRG